jgi:hypothetical protein
LVARTKFDHVPASGAFWITCEYGEHAAFLSRPMPSGIAQCVVTHEKPRSGLLRYRFKSLSCN